MTIDPFLPNNVQFVHDRQKTTLLLGNQAGCDLFFSGLRVGCIRIARLPSGGAAHIFRGGGEADVAASDPFLFHFHCMPSRLMACDL